MGVSTWLTIVLLVLAASLASYLLSQWSPIRDRAIAWAGIGLGTTWLIAAVAILVISAGFVAKLSFVKPTLDPQTMIKPPNARAGQVNPLLETVVTDPNEPTGAEAGSERTPNHLSARAPKNESGSGDLPQSAAKDQEQVATGGNLTPAVIDPAVSSAAASVDPWAATQCVVVLQRDPAEPTRWTIENDCGAPVGVIVAACTQTAVDCEAAGVTSWKYSYDEVLLPNKAWRTITEAEQTVFGEQILDAACIVSAPAAIELIGMDAHARASDTWRADFSIAREADPCLLQLRSFAERGRRTGLSPDALRGEAQRVSAR
jgi:hypothetical protein